MVVLILWTIIIGGTLFVAVLIWSTAQTMRRIEERNRRSLEGLTPEQKLTEMQRRAAFGELKPEVICPYCQTKGTTRTKNTIQKTGISGAKTTAAVLTGGVSILATGLSQKENVFRAHCDHCKMTYKC